MFLDVCVGRAKRCVGFPYLQRDDLERAAAAIHGECDSRAGCPDFTLFFARDPLFSSKFSRKMLILRGPFFHFIFREKLINPNVREELDARKREPTQQPAPRREKTKNVGTHTDTQRAFRDISLRRAPWKDASQRPAHRT